MCWLSCCVSRAATVQMLSLEKGTEDRLTPSHQLTLPHCPLDITFDPRGRLWVLLDSADTPFQVYTHTQDGWQVGALKPIIWGKTS